jgi:cytochrome c oxidase subunit 3
MSTVATTAKKTSWDGGSRPFNLSYGKMMMWFFILSDALTFSGFLAAYGLMRFKFIDSWPIAEEVFTHIPFTHSPQPLLYVAFMTFILIFSSVTMVLAVDAGHQMKKNKVILYMLLTIVGGFIFIGSQAWEWKTFINGSHGALETRSGNILQFVDAHGKPVNIHSFAIGHSEREPHTRMNGIWFSEDKFAVPTVTVENVTKGFAANHELRIKTENIIAGHKEILSHEASLAKIKQAVGVVEGANMIHNEYGKPLFANFFFFITGFHGFHVLSGIIINIIIFFNVVLGTYEKRGHYEMVEKVGLYWHFVDLVWVFVFTFFYLV